MEILEMNLEYFKNKKVLITGFNGFKGTWLTMMLNHLGAKCYGYSERPKEEFKLQKIIDIESICQSHYADIKDQQAYSNFFNSVSPDIGRFLDSWYPS